MNKKRLFILLLILIMFPIIVYAEDGVTDATSNSSDTQMACVADVLYDISGVGETKTFKYSHFIRSYDLPYKRGNWGFNIGQEYNSCIRTPDDFYKVLKSIKENYKMDKPDDPCPRRQNNDNERKNVASCRIYNTDDSKLMEIAIDLANYNDKAVTSKIGLEKANYRNGFFTWSVEPAQLFINLFSVRCDNKDFTFTYSLSSSHAWGCTTDRNDSDPIFSADGTGWKTQAVDYNWASCPTTDDLNEISRVTDKVTVDWNYNTSQWDVTIPDLNKVKIRFIKKCQEYDSDGTCGPNSLEFAHPISIIGDQYNYDYNDVYCEVSEKGSENSINTCATASGNDYNRYHNVYATDKYKIQENGKTKEVYAVKFNANSGESIFYDVAFYTVNGQCNDSSVYWHRFAISSVVDNPYINSDKYKSAYDVCYGTNGYLSQMEGRGYSRSFALALVPECGSKTIQTWKIEATNGYEKLYNGTDYSGYTYVRNKIDNTLKNFGQHDGGKVTKIGDTNCEMNFVKDDQIFDDKNQVVYTYSSLLYNEDTDETVTDTQYWNAWCTETITMKFLSPQKVSKSGQGFTYPIEVTQNRECSPMQVAVPRKKPACAHAIECWGGPPEHTGTGAAGPNTEFDNCIADCDGGLYSQACINKCYNNSYAAGDVILGLAQSRNLTRASGADFSACVVGEKFTFTTKVHDKNKTYTTKSPVSSCDVDDGNASTGAGNCTTTYCLSTHGIKYTYLNGCNGNSSSDGVACIEVYLSDTDCLEVYYGNERINNIPNAYLTRRLIPSLPDDPKGEQYYYQDYCKDRSDMNCYEQVEYAKQVYLAEQQYKQVIEDAQLFVENPAATRSNGNDGGLANFFTITLNNKGTTYKFNQNDHINVTYKKLINGDWSTPYDLNSFNMTWDKNANDNYRKLEIIPGETKAIEDYYTELNKAKYNEFFSAEHIDNTKRIDTYSIERKYVFNLPDVKIDNRYTDSSNYDYEKAHEYTMNHKETYSQDNSTDVVYPRSFITYTPDIDGINFYRYAEFDGKVEDSWDHFYLNKTGVNGLTEYVDNNYVTDWDNIRFTYQLGTWGQVKNENNSDTYGDIVCFYGIPPCTDPGCIPIEVTCETPPCPTPTPTPACTNPPCNGGGGGQAFIFRTIELRNMFPCNGGECNYTANTNVNGLSQRSPRYNWSNKALEDFMNSYIYRLGTYNYVIDPEATQNNIEKAGADIYQRDDEIDYDLTLTQTQIREIRKYGNGSKKYNFGDYSGMECYFNKSTMMNVCYSNMLHNTNYVTINDGKQGILGCNNQSGTQCLK